MGAMNPVPTRLRYDNIYIVNWILFLKDMTTRVALPSQLGNLGSNVRYLSGDRGKAPAENEFGSF